VRRGDGEYSQAVSFEVRAPEKIFSIRAGSDAETVARAHKVSVPCAHPTWLARV